MRLHHGITGAGHMDFNAVCRFDGAWSVQRMRDALQASEPDDVAACASAIASVVQFQPGGAASLTTKRFGALGGFAQRLQDLPLAHYPVGLPTSGGEPVAENALGDLHDIQQAFFSAAMQASLERGERAHLADPAGSTADALAFIRIHGEKKAREGVVVGGFGERHVLGGGWHDEVVTPDYELAAIGGALLGMRNSDEPAAHSDFNDAVHQLTEQRLWPAVIGAMAGFHGATHAAGQWIDGHYESFKRIGELAQMVYAQGDASSRTSVAEALDAVAGRIEHAHGDTHASARTGDAPDTGWLRTMAHLLRQRTSALPEAPPMLRASLQHDLATVSRVHGGAKLSWPQLHEAAQALVRLGADATLFERAVAVAGPPGVGYMMIAAIGYDPANQRFDPTEGMRRPQPLLQALIGAAHGASDARACKTVGVTLELLARQIAELRDERGAQGGVREEALPLEPLMQMLAARQGMAHGGRALSLTPALSR